MDFCLLQIITDQFFSPITRDNALCTTDQLRCDHFQCAYVIVIVILLDSHVTKTALIAS